MAYCLDNAVVQFGRVTEGKLSERDKRGKYKHSLKALLAEPVKGSKGPRKITNAELLAMGIPVKVKP